MAKNILIFSDGTGQAGGYMPDEARTNVYKLFRATRVCPDTCIDPKLQIAFYDGGLGSRASGEGIKIKWWRRLYNLLGKVTGLGITQNIIDCYAAIIRVWQPGDRIYLFGFSRGAYTVRCVAGVLKYCGVPTAIDSNGQALPLQRDLRSARRIATEAVKHVYQYGSSIKGDPYHAERAQRAVRFRGKYFAGDSRVSNTAPYFIGAWDTIATLGAGTRGLAALTCAYEGLSLGAAYLLAVASEGLFWPTLLSIGLGLPAALYLMGCIRYGGLVSLARYRMAFYDTRLHYAVRYARHALSIDENRKKFDCIPWHDGDELRHILADGHGKCRASSRYGLPAITLISAAAILRPSSRLSDISLAWMVEEAMSLPQPIYIDHSVLNMYPDCAGPQHDERKAFLSAFPDWVTWCAIRLVGPKNLGWREGHRHIAPDAQLHRTVYERFALGAVLIHGAMSPYRPRALRRHLDISKVWAKPERSATGQNSAVGESIGRGRDAWLQDRQRKPPSIPGTNAPAAAHGRRNAPGG